MPPKPRGEILERQGKRGTAFQIRFMAYGKRRRLTVGNSSDGYTRADAENELAFILEQVRRGIWTAPTPAPPPDEPGPAPTFHRFASEWFGRHRGEWSERTIEQYEDDLRLHLLPFFARHLLSEITIEEIDRYKAAKVRERTERLVERPLSNATINRTLTRLGQILQEAVEHGHLVQNPMRVGRRKLKARQPRRASLDARQVAALLSEAGRSRALIATALMAGGLRASELCWLRWRDVSLASATLRVPRSKTEAGEREVDLAPDLLELLQEHKARARWARAEDFVFPGKHRDRPRDRRALSPLMKRAVKRANRRLIREEWQPISEEATFHSLRRTYATLMAEMGADPAYTMRQIGHRKAAFTLSVYTDVKARRDAANRRLGALLRSDAS
jgi:integrase